MSRLVNEVGGMKKMPCCFLAFFLLLILLFALQILFSCNAVSFELLDTQVSVNEKSAYYDKENIEVDFSLPMKTEIVEKNITLKKDDAAVETEIVWKNKKCLIKPLGGFCLGQEYLFNLSGEVKTSDGRAYTVDISRKFIFGNKENIFSIEKIITPDSKNAVLEFYFNKELHIASFEQEFKITPYIELKKEFSADKKSVKIFPCDKWENNTFYTWTIENVLSADCYKIYKTYSNEFMAVNENERPEIICICPVILDEDYDACTATFVETDDLSALFGKQPFGIIFNKPMDFDSVKSALYFEPSLSGVLLQADDCKFVYMPYDNYKIGQKYLLRVGNGAKDIFGLKMSEQKNFYFTSGDEFLKIDSVYAGTTPLEKDKISEIDSTNDGTLFIKINFSSNIATENSTNIEKAISLNVGFPNTLNPAKLNSITVNENCVSIQWNNLSKQTGDADCIYELKISGGKNYVATKFGTYLEEDECYYLRIK